MSAPTLDERIIQIYRDLENRPDFPRTQIRKKIAIISTPRCGSSLFCDVLLNTGKFGYPGEWFNPRFFLGYRRFFKLTQINLHTYLDFIQKKTTSPNGVFSVKFHVNHYRQLLNNNHFDLFALNFDRIYYLNRRDKLAQAISLRRALLTGQWTSTTRPINNLPEKTSRSSAIEQLLFISKLEDFYESHIKKYVNCTFYYEDFRSLTDTDIFSQIMTDSGASKHNSGWETSMSKQSDSVSKEELVVLKKYLGCTDNN